MALSKQSFCSTTAHKLRTVHTDFDVENHHFHLKKHNSVEDLGEFIAVKYSLLPSLLVGRSRL